MVCIAIMLIGYTLDSRQRNNSRPPDIPKGPDSEKDFANQQAFMNWPEEATVATIGPIVAHNEHITGWYLSLRKVRCVHVSSQVRLL